MQRLPVLFVATLLAFSSIVGNSSAVSSQSTPEAPADVVVNCERGRAPTFQEEEEVLAGDMVDWEGVCRPVPREMAIPQPTGDDVVTRSFAVELTEDFAAIPVIDDAEFMVVTVQHGVFALDVEPATPGDVVVYAAGSDIPVLHPTREEPFYVESGDVLEDAANAACTRPCVVPPGTAVQLNAGDRVVADAGALCLYCLIGTNQTRDTDDPETGLLEVFLIPGAGESLETFSWLESFTQFQYSPSASSADAPTSLSWAFFHPSTRCRGGR